MMTTIKDCLDSIDLVPEKSVYFAYDGKVALVEDTLDNILTATEARGAELIKSARSLPVKGDEQDKIDLIINYIQWCKGVPGTIERIRSQIDAFKNRDDLSEITLEQITIVRKNLLTTIANYASSMESQWDYVRLVYTEEKFTRH